VAKVGYRILPHTADVRLAVWGASEEELISNTVAGALALALGRPPGGAPTSTAAIRRWPESLEGRLVAAANEAIFLLFARRLLAVGVRVSHRGAELAVRPLAEGEDPEREIKAATFHALRPRREGERLRAVLVLDL
jgi:SHS2 domain-containing protein